MNLNEQSLSAIADLLNDGAHNYSVFLRCYVVPIKTNINSTEYIRQALGNSAIVAGVEPIAATDLIREVEAALSYLGDSGAGPSSAAIRSPTFGAHLAQLLFQLESLAVKANKMERFWLSEGHPAYPVFWDFAFLFTCADEAVVFVGSSSD